MKKNKTIVLLIILFMLVLLFSMSKGQTEKSAMIPVDESEIITSSKMGYNSVFVYQKEGYILINANSMYLLTV